METSLASRQSLYSYHYSFMTTIIAVDETQVPDYPSDIEQFQIQSDKQPPFLKVTTPASKNTLALPSATIEGEVEPGSSLTIEGKPVSTDEQGHFSHVQSLIAHCCILVLETSLYACQTRREAKERANDL